MFNKIKDKKIFWTSIGLLLFSSILLFVFSIVSIVMWNNNNWNLATILDSINCGLIVPLFISSIVVYFLSDNTLNKKIFILLTTLSSFAIFLIILGTILFLIKQPNTQAVGMWFLIFGSFGLLFSSFTILLRYLFIKRREKPNYEHILKDPTN